VFLSRVSAKPDDAFAYARLVGLTPYDAHQAVWSLFNDPSASRDFLFRRETAPAQACLMVLSTRIPQAASSVLRVDTKPFEPKLQVGDRLQFDVRANAVKTTHDGPGSDQGKRGGTRKRNCATDGRTGLATHSRGEARIRTGTRERVQPPISPFQENTQWLADLL